MGTIKDLVEKQEKLEAELREVNEELANRAGEVDDESLAVGSDRVAKGSDAGRKNTPRR